MNNIAFLKELPEDVVIPLLQHKGAVCEPVVSVGDTVLAGQKIGEASGAASAPVHASVSGTVAAIEERPHPFGTKVLSVVITLDETQETAGSSPVANPKALEIKQIIKDAGIVEIHGTPTCDVIENIDTIIMNASYKSTLIAGCVGICSYPHEVHDGLKYMMEASGAKQAVIVVNKVNKEALDALAGMELEDNIKVVPAKTKYTPGMEDLLVYDIMGTTTQIGGNPEDVGVGVCGVNTAYEVYDAVTTGRPSMHIPVSISGSVGNPQSLLVPIGMRFKDVIEACGGYSGDVGKVVMNGLTIGIAQYTDDVPVVKQTAGIVVVDKKDVLRDEVYPCIHCARCVDVCPVDLIPSRIATYSDQGRYEECRGMHVMNCVECGECAVACPSKIHILQLIWRAKVAIDRAYADTAEKQTSNLTLGCCGGA